MTFLLFISLDRLESLRRPRQEILKRSDSLVFHLALKMRAIMHFIKSTDYEKDIKLFVIFSNSPLSSREKLKQKWFTSFKWLAHKNNGLFYFFFYLSADF